ncbi:MAG: hypothetical protein ACERKU_06700, partial [Nitrospirota bacterium]
DVNLWPSRATLATELQLCYGTVVLGWEEERLYIIPHKNPQRKVNHSEDSEMWSGVWEYA